MLKLAEVLIGLVAKGPAAKAIASAIPGAITGVLIGPEVLDAFQTGLAAGGTVPAAHQLGMVVGGLVLAAVNYAVTWLAPANKPSTGVSLFDFPKIALGIIIALVLIAFAVAVVL